MNSQTTADNPRELNNREQIQSYSKIESLMLTAKAISDKADSEENKAFRKPKSLKGKSPSLTEKLSGTNIKEWVLFINPD